MMTLERRAFPLTEIRMFEENNTPKIEGYAAVFNELSQDLGGFREKIAPGAFSNTLQTADVRALWNHDPNFVLGRNKSGTLTLQEDQRGLRIEITPPNTQWAEDLMTSMKRGDVDQMSFGFRTVADEWTTQGSENIRTLKEVELFDVSIVTYPAYPQTTAHARSWDTEGAMDTAEFNRLMIRLRHGLPLMNQDWAAIRSWRDFLGHHLGEIRAASGATDLPLADRNHAWDAAAAIKRVREWAGGDNFDQSKFAKAFFYYDENAPDPDGDGKPDAQSAYKLPFADIIDGKLIAIPRGIFAVAAVLQGARGGVDIPQSDIDGIKKKVERYYARMRQEFGDDSIVPPWEKSSHSAVPEDHSAMNRLTAKVEQEPSLAHEASQTPQERNLETLRRKIELLKRRI